MLLREVLELLRVEKDRTYVDGTVGLGGHSEAILEASSPAGILYGFEWNEDSFEFAKRRLSKYGDRVRLYKENFIYIKDVLQREGVLVDGILLDLGLSSYLLEHSGRGFSFQKEEILDMRMSLETSLTAKEVMNSYPYERLVQVFEKGEVPKAREFAKFICRNRKKQPIITTKDLARIVKEFYKTSKKDLLAVIFQSLRIEVNRELENLEIALTTLPEILKPGGRIAIISFHSLEDRLVKRSFSSDIRLKIITKKPIVPSPEEIKKNPRARSAKLRVGEKI